MPSIGVAMRQPFFRKTANHDDYKRHQKIKNICAGTLPRIKIRTLKNMPKRSESAAKDPDEADTAWKRSESRLFQPQS